MKAKEYWRLYRLVSKTKGLGEKRHVMFEQNRAMKWLGYLFAAFWCAYLLFFGVVFGNAFSDGPIEGFDIIDGGLMVFLALDFGIRFMLTETPAQEVKPFKLMPISTKFLINIFLVRRILSAFNLVWLFFLVPFGLIQLPHYYGLGGFFIWLFAWWLVFAIHSQVYLLWRTIINRNFLYALIPIAIYAFFFYAGLFDDDYTRTVFGDNVQWLFYSCLYWWRGVLDGSIVPFITLFAILAVFFFLNQVVQNKSIYREIAEVQESKVKSREMTLFNRFGIIGEYLKLEVRSVIRNAVVRKQFLLGVFFMLLLSCMTAFSPVYDNNLFMKAYISMYCYCVLATMTLVNAMCPEGNYIDGLMARKESVLSLLKAKYYFNLAMFLIPFCVFLVTVFQGKSTIGESLGCMLFSAGVVMPALFQMAVYNNITIDMNKKLTRAGRSSKMQIIVSFVALFGPMIIMYVLMTVIPDYSSLILGAIGVVGIATHPLWLRNVYNRFMARRYKNMDGFRSSRNA
ncbi:MAG: hypothetical protein J5663_12480 [Bacteroidaceae bacterium]|nr:hypothetical protein [Bacteroidaceae bacterium]